MSEYAIKVEVSASSRAAVISLFKEQVRWLEAQDYAVTEIPHMGSFAGSGGYSASHSTEVKGPPEPPLSQAEIRKLRAIIPNIAG